MKRVKNVNTRCTNYCGIIKICAWSQFSWTVNFFVDSLVRRYNKILRLMFFKKLLVPVEGYPGNPKKTEPLRIKMIPQETSIY